MFKDYFFGDKADRINIKGNMTKKARTKRKHSTTILFLKMIYPTNVELPPWYGQ